jgi:hypothetical protein
MLEARIVHIATRTLQCTRVLVSSLVTTTTRADNNRTPPIPNHKPVSRVAVRPTSAFSNSSRICSTLRFDGGNDISTRIKAWNTGVEAGSDSNLNQANHTRSTRLSTSQCAVCQRASKPVHRHWCLMMQLHTRFPTCALPLCHVGDVPCG